MSMRLALKASLDEAARDEKSRTSAAKKLKAQAKKERKAALAAEAGEASSATAPAAPVDDGLDEATRELRSRVSARLTAVLEGADLEELRLSSLRKQLEAELGVALAGDNKAWFKARVTTLVSDAQNAPRKKPSDLADDEEDPRHPELSDELAAVLGVGRANHFRVIKLIWKYIKGHELQNPENRNEILCDEKLRAVFKKDKVTGFGMTKLIGAHVHKNEGPAAPRPKKRKAEPAEGGAPAKRPAAKRSGAPAEYKGSAALAAFCGEQISNRFTINKIVWAHIKQHSLQRPTDKRTIVCDETLKNLFKVDDFNMFHLSKLIGAHFPPK